MDNKELLIIGNGFDLSIGLKTTYKDFFEDRYSSLLIQMIKHFIKDGILPNNNILAEQLKNVENINFWDIFFIIKYIDTDNKDKNWSNIEEEIRLFLINKDRGNKFGKAAFKRCIELYLANNFISFNRLENNRYAFDLLRFVNKTNNLNVDNLDNFLNSELVIFENIFAKYINQQVSANNEYEKKSDYLIKSIVSDVKQTSIFSFNYTEVKNADLFSVENVHGKADKEIIFGIDYKDLDYNSEEYRYSKTYRKLLMNVKNSYHQSLPINVSKIKFYGHSLSDADYSYFQSIFDFYSIYSSNVNIEFFFYVFDENSRKEILNNQLSSVTSLLSIYGETMTNENHGKNLIHKLLLENRIRITEIDSTGKLVNS